MEEDRFYKMVEKMLTSVKDKMDEEWKLRETRMLETLRLEKIESEHRFNQLKTETLTEFERMLRMLKDPSPTPDSKNMELSFSNKISQPILTGDEIKGEDNDCIQVVLRDSSTRNIVDIGSVASARVEIVVLAQGTDDLTGEGFNEKIVGVEGKLPLLTVDVCKLQGGIGSLENVKFRHHATDVKPSEFRLGARIAERFDGIIVKEAKTESFVVKSYRNKYSRKNEIPHLWDKIWVLKNIHRRGKIDERLQAEEIDTVEKFLIQLLINHQKLRNIVGLGRKKWEATVTHAKNCQSDKMYWYMNSQENTGVVFNIFGKLQGLYSGGEYAATNMSSENKKVDAEKLLSSAFEHWKDVTPFDDPDSLQQHLAAIKTSFNLSNSHIPGHPGTDPETWASNMVDESNNFEVPDPLFDQGIHISDTTSFSHFESFSVRDGWHDQNWDRSTTISDIDFDLIYGMNVGMNVDASVVGTGSLSAQSEFVVPGFVVPGSKSQRKWKMLLCVSRWISIRKWSNFKAHPARKKQKIC